MTPTSLDRSLRAFLENTTMTCWECQGRGYEQTLFANTCRRCSGTGEISMWAALRNHLEYDVELPDELINAVLHAMDDTGRAGQGAA